MNNQQFRKLLDQAPKDVSSEARQSSNDNDRSASSKRNLGLLAPRAVRRPTDNSYKLKQNNTQDRPTKRFKSSAPLGSRVADGYTDRAQARNQSTDDALEDEKAERIRKLEEQMREGEISLESFEAQREEITGGDVSNTHLVKGLDRKLLERVKRGEDVMGATDAKQDEEDEGVDDELDKLEDQHIATVQKQKSEKRGILEPAARKRTRDEIMADLKAQRKAAMEAKKASEPDLGDRWKRIDDKTRTRIEIDKKGREVLVITDEDGKVTRKVRKVVAEHPDKHEAVVDPEKEVLGADIVVPEMHATTQNDDEDDDIFEGVGTEYDPLGADMADSDEDPVETPQNTSAAIKAPTNTGGKINYFNDKKSEQDPSIEKHIAADMEAVIRKAARMADTQERAAELDTEEAARRAKHAVMLSNRDRDLDDMDLGFGGSRNDDEQEAEDGGTKIRLSEWSERGNDHDEEESGHKDKKKRSRKRKGDANNMGDIMKVIERRQKS